DGRIRACLPGPLPIVSGGVRPAFPDAGALGGEKRPARRLGEEGRRWAGVERSRPRAWKRAAEEAAEPVAEARTAPLAGCRKSRKSACFAFFGTRKLLVF